MSVAGYKTSHDSGIEWIGHIPDHWRLMKVKHACQFTTGWTPPTGRDEYYGGEHPWANISDLGPRVISETAKTVTQKALDDAEACCSPKGSLLFSFKLSVGQVSFAGRDLYTNEAIATFHPGGLCDLRYGYYALPLYVVSNAAENIYGAKLLNQDLIKNAILCLPPLPEQATIATFLDRETGKIDALVEEQRRLVALLKEKRQAVISHAVTRGLDPSTPMKDSGVEWLGEVPAHWEVAQLKRLVEFQRGHDLPSDRREPGEVPIISSAGVIGEHVEAAAHGPAIVTGRYGSIGQFYAVEGPFWPLNTTLYSTSLFGHPPFIRRALQNLAPLFVMHAVKSAVPGVDRNDLHPLPVAIPPAAEQMAIADALDRYLGKLGRLEAEAERAINLLQERRAALISAAVTGKIDVRGLAPAEAEAA